MAQLWDGRTWDAGLSARLVVHLLGQYELKPDFVALAHAMSKDVGWVVTAEAVRAQFDKLQAISDEYYGIDGAKEEGEGEGKKAGKARAPAAGEDGKAKAAVAGEGGKAKGRRQQKRPRIPRYKDPMNDREPFEAVDTCLQQ